MLGDEFDVSSLSYLIKIMSENLDKKYYSKIGKIQPYNPLRINGDKIEWFNYSTRKWIHLQDITDTIQELKYQCDYRTVHVWYLCALLCKYPKKKFIDRNGSIYSWDKNKNCLLVDGDKCFLYTWSKVSIKKYTPKKKIVFNIFFGEACKNVFKDKIVVRLPNKEIKEHIHCPMGLTQMTYLKTARTVNGRERKFIKFKPLGSELADEFSFENAVDEFDTNAMYAVFDSMKELEEYEL